jgi:radical SAM-linked protein
VRAFNRAGVSLVYSEGYHPMPKLSFAAALPVGTESLHETLQVQWRGFSADRTLKEKIHEQLPPGLEIRALDILDRETGSLKNKEVHYDVSFNGVKVDEDLLEQFLASDSLPVTKKRKKGDRKIDARVQVKSAYFNKGSTIRLVLKPMEGPSLKPEEIIQGMFHLSDEELEGVVVLKIMEIPDSKESEDERPRAQIESMALNP